MTFSTLAISGPRRIRGRGGHDLICGEGGDDRIAGGAGRDDVNGGRGGDALAGGAGQDICRGGRPRDDRLPDGDVADSSCETVSGAITVARPPA